MAGRADRVDRQALARVGQRADEVGEVGDIEQVEYLDPNPKFLVPPKPTAWPRPDRLQTTVRESVALEVAIGAR
jgi:hypothetical protein